MPDPTPPTPTPTPGPTAPTPTPDPTATPPADPTPNPTPADDGPVFANERDKRRWAELTGRVGVRERERDDARGRLEHVLRVNAERIAATSLAEPADVWLEGATVADVLTDDGSDIDPAKVSAIVATIVAKRPGLKRQPAPTALHGIHGVQTPIGERQSLESAVRRIAAGRGGI